MAHTPYGPIEVGRGWEVGGFTAPYMTPFNSPGGYPKIYQASESKTSVKLKHCDLIFEIVISFFCMKCPGPLVFYCPSLRCGAISKYFLVCNFLSFFPDLVQ